MGRKVWIHGKGIVDIDIKPQDENEVVKVEKLVVEIDGEEHEFSKKDIVDLVLENTELITKLDELSKPQANAETESQKVETESQDEVQPQANAETKTGKKGK